MRALITYITLALFTLTLTSQSVEYTQAWESTAKGYNQLIIDNKIIVSGNSGTYGIDADDGTEIWHIPQSGELHNFDDQIYILNGNRIILLDTNNGNLIINKLFHDKQSEFKIYIEGSDLYWATSTSDPNFLPASANGAYILRTDGAIGRYNLYTNATWHSWYSSEKDFEMVSIVTYQNKVLVSGVEVGDVIANNSQYIPIFFEEPNYFISSFDRISGVLSNEIKDQGIRDFTTKTYVELIKYDGSIYSVIIQSGDKPRITLFKMVDLTDLEFEYISFSFSNNGFFTDYKFNFSEDGKIIFAPILDDSAVEIMGFDLEKENLSFWINIISPDFDFWCSGNKLYIYSPQYLQLGFFAGLALEVTNGLNESGSYLTVLDLENPAIISMNKVLEEGILSNILIGTSSACDEVFLANSDLTLKKFQFDVSYPNFNDIISPSNISGYCINGFVPQIIGHRIPALGGKVPSYVWEISQDNINWDIIPGANSVNYTPSIFPTQRLYRRKVVDPCDNEKLISTSSITQVSGSDFIAPNVDAGFAQYTCPGIPVLIGGAETIEGGLAPFNIQWNQEQFLNDNTISNPLATIDENTVFTVTVTDANNCSNIAQNLVRAINVNAGPDISLCDSAGPFLATLGKEISAYTVSYEWSPANGLSCTTCPEPEVTLTTNQEYTVNGSLLLETGESCTTQDEVQVSYYSNPSSGLQPEYITCFKDDIQIGVESNNQASYNWLSYNDGYAYFLDSRNVSNPNYVQQSHTSPSILSDTTRNPFRYSLYTSIDGCEWRDTTTVYGLIASAGFNGCGPRTIGDGDFHPQIDAEYAWTVVSGPDKITGPRNEPTTTVDGSDDETTVYQLEVCYNGHCCIDQVAVPPCQCRITLNDNTCELTSGFDYSATATYSLETDPDDWTYVWSPCEAFDNCIGREVTLVVPEVSGASITATYNLDPTITCSANLNPLSQDNGTIKYNPGGPHTVCAGETLQLGELNNNDYEYTWNAFPAIDINDLFIDDNQQGLPNPIITIPHLSSGESNFSVRVSVRASDVCTKSFSIPITVYSTPETPDINTCPNNIITLGQPEATEGLFDYSWTPANAAWQNGTNQNSPQPEVLIAGEQEFILTATTPSGCEVKDTILVSGLDNPSVDAGPDVETCQGTDVQIGLEPSPTIIAYEWTPSVGLSCVDCPQPIVNAEQSRNYLLVATYEGGCRSTADDVFVSIYEQAAFELEDIEHCPDDDGTELNPRLIGECPDCTYRWSGRDLVGITELNASTTTGSEGTYTLTVTDENGCTNTASLFVSIPNKPSAGIDLSVCVGETITLGDSDNSILSTWVTDQTLSCTTCAQPSFTATEAGEFEIEVISDMGACMLNDVVAITVVDLGEIEVETDYQVCENGCVDIILDNSQNLDYNMIPSDDVVSSSESMITICPAETGSQTLSIVNPSSGCTIEKELNFNFFDAEAPSISVDNLLVCTDELVSLGVEISSENGHTSSWSPSIGLSDPVADNPDLDPSFLSLGTNTYTLTVSDVETGCSSISQVEIEKLSLPQGEVQYMVCMDGCITIGVIPEDGIDYTWEGNEVTGESASYIDVCPSETTTYDLSMSLSGTECNSDISFEVTVSENSAPVVEIDDAVICDEEVYYMEASITPASDNLSYSWSPSALVGNEVDESPQVLIDELSEGTNVFVLNVIDNVTSCEAVSESVIELCSEEVDPPVLDGSCFTIDSESPPCNDDVNSESIATYTYNFTFTNNNEATFDKLLILETDDNFSLDAGSTLVQLSSELAPGQSVELSWGIDALSSFSEETITYCFDIAPYGSEGPCCKEQHCVELTNCCPTDIPPTKSTVMQDMDDCCYTFGYETCQEDYIVVADFAMLTEGLGFTATASDGYQVNTFSDRTFSLTMTGGSFLPPGNHSDILQFCIDGMNSMSPEEQEFTVTWRALVEDGTQVIGIDTCTLNCPIPPDQCAELIDPEVYCDDNGVYHYQFRIKNINELEYEASIAVLGPEGTTIPADFSQATFPDFPDHTPNGEEYLEHNETTGIIDITLPNAILGSTYQFIISLHDYRNIDPLTGDYWCCYTPGEPFTITVDEDCIIGFTDPNPVEYFVYPNPASEVFTVRFMKPLESASELVMVNINGEIKNRVALPAGATAHSLGIADLNTGMYFISVKDEQGNEYGERFVKK